MFLAWLAEHATEPDTSVFRRVHGLVPLTGHSVSTTAWQLAEQLQLSARTPGELLAAVAQDQRRTVIVLPDLHESTEPEAIEELACALAALNHVRVIVETRQPSPALLAQAPAVMDLADPQWTDPDRQAAWAVTTPIAEQVTTPAGPDHLVSLDLDDPAFVCAADPLLVTASYERTNNLHGGLRTAWLRSGPSLSRPQDPASRACVLWAALGDDADPRLRGTLEALAQESGWSVRWNRVRGDINPPWPGPAQSMSTSPVSQHRSLSVLDHQGVVRLLLADSGHPLGRLTHPVTEASAITVADDQTTIILGSDGRLSLHKSPTATRLHGIASLLDQSPSTWERLLQEAALNTGVTAFTSGHGQLATGDRDGTVHVLAWNNPSIEHSSAALHDATVTALAAVQTSAGSSLVYSGGQDGRVRLWATDREPLPSPVAERDCAVVALAAASAEDGIILAIGWADGLVEYSSTGPDSGTSRRTFRPGPPIRALSLLPEGDLVIGTDESLICLQPR
ncbi:hypothetical protein ACFQ7A_03390 [Streptomyces sp. NPDC056528]|uniref:hypothetical protein n=1 Tax=Streptomyces sp. NPDC056528 TaxID=3345854 RepID=UPI00369F324D